MIKRGKKVLANWSLWCSREARAARLQEHQLLLVLHIKMACVQFAETCELTGKPVHFIWWVRGVQSEMHQWMHFHVAFTLGKNNPSFLMFTKKKIPPRWSGTNVCFKNRSNERVYLKKRSAAILTHCSWSFFETYTLSLDWFLKHTLTLDRFFIEGIIFN